MNVKLRGNKILKADKQMLDNYKDCYFRFQNMDWEIGTQSFGMIYSTADEALEDGSTVLDGKSCVSEWRRLYQFMEQFDDDFCVLVFKGEFNGYGHDGEDVVIPNEIVACFDYDSFTDLLAEEFDEAEYPYHEFHL